MDKLGPAERMTDIYFCIEGVECFWCHKSPTAHVICNHLDINDWYCEDCLVALLERLKRNKEYSLYVKDFRKKVKG